MDEPPSPSDDRPVAVSTEATTDAPSRGRLGALTNAIVSGSATLIAIVALVVGIYQAKLSRDQANNSVWPFLLHGNANNNGYARIIQNVGIGPAKIGAFEVTVGGKIVHNWREVAESLHIAPSWRGTRSTTIRAGILPANTTTDILELPDSDDARMFRAAIAKIPLHTWICFCSIYDKCWAGIDTARTLDEPRSCHADSSRAFRDN